MSVSTVMLGLLALVAKPKLSLSKLPRASESRSSELDCARARIFDLAADNEALRGALERAWRRNEELVRELDRARLSQLGITQAQRDHPRALPAQQALQLLSQAIGQAQQNAVNHSRQCNCVPARHDALLGGMSKDPDPVAERQFEQFYAMQNAHPYLCIGG
jgi:hypothetical protein